MTDREEGDFALALLLAFIVVAIIVGIGITY